jgi:hypothetical protein
LLNFRIPGYADLRRIVPITLIVALLFAAEAWLPSASGRAELSPLLTSAAMVVLLAGISHILRRIFFPDLDLHAVADKASAHPIGAGLVFLGVCAVLAVLLVLPVAMLR